MAEILGDAFSWVWSDRSFSDRLGLISLAIQIGGVVWLIVEINAVRRRIADATGRMQTLQALANGFELKAAAVKLRSEVEDDTAVDAVSGLVERCGQMSLRLRGHLENAEDPRAAELIRLLILVSGQAYATGEAVRGGGRNPLKRKTTQFRKALDDAVGEFDHLVARIEIAPKGKG